MKMNSKTFGLFSMGLLLVVMMLGIASAVVNVINTSSTEVSGSHNSQVSFSIYAQGVDFTGQFDDANFVFSDIFGTSTTWSGNSTFILLPESNSTVQTLQLTIPQYQGAGIYTGNINFTGDYSLPGDIVINALPITINITETPSLTVSSATFDSDGNATITITNTGNTELTNITLTDTGAFDVTFNETNKTSLSAGVTWDVVVSIAENVEDLVGANSVTITATANETSGTGTVTLNKDYCNGLDSNSGNIDVSIEDIRITGFGDEWDFWYPFDNVEVEVDVENNANDDIRDVIVEWGVYNTKTGEWIVQEEENDFRLKEDDTETLILSFKLDDDIDELDSGNFVFYVRAIGEDEENDNEEICAYDKESTGIIIESDFVILDDIKLNGLELDGTYLVDPISCGSDLVISADVWNIGDSQQDDVYVTIDNYELGINEKIDIGDIDEFDNDKLDYTLHIPENAESTKYVLEFRVYDEDDDIYENGEDDVAKFTATFNIEGSCIIKTDTKVSAALESGGKTGEPLVVKTTIVNNGDNSITYLINPANYADWADSVELDEKTFTLGTGESKELTLTFELKEDVKAGDKLFDLEVLSGNDLIVSQPVSVSIEKSSGWDRVSGITGNVISESNWHLWGIGILNVVLILLIIFVGLKVVKNN